MVGDSAGLITPLAGNGMSIAIRAGIIAADLASSFLRNEISRSEMEAVYTNLWNKNFKKRLWRGRQLQRLFGNERVSNITVSFLKSVPVLLQPIIKSTHGKLIEIN
jgi:flavin-dependent dehydrogenase